MNQVREVCKPKRLESLNQELKGLGQSLQVLICGGLQVTCELGIWAVWRADAGFLLSLLCAWDFKIRAKE